MTGPVAQVRREFLHCCAVTFYRDLAVVAPIPPVESHTLNDADYVRGREVAVWRHWRSVAQAAFRDPSAATAAAAMRLVDIEHLKLVQGAQGARQRRDRSVGGLSYLGVWGTGVLARTAGESA